MSTTKKQSRDLSKKLRYKNIQHCAKMKRWSAIAAQMRNEAYSTAFLTASLDAPDWINNVAQATLRLWDDAVTGRHFPNE